MRVITGFYWMLKFLKYLGFFDDEKNTLLFYTLEVIPYAEVMFYFSVPRDSPFHMQESKFFFNKVTYRLAHKVKYVNFVQLVMFCPLEAIAKCCY